VPIDPTGFRTETQTETPTRVDLPISSPEFYRDLQVPKPVLQDLRLLAQFFSTQGARLHSMETTEKIKSLSAEIHEFEEIEQELASFGALAPDEEQFLDQFYEETRSSLLVGAQSGDLEELIRKAKEYVASQPMPSDSSSSSSEMPGGDILDQVFMGEVSRQKEERETRYLELLAAAKDPETAILAIAYRYSDLYGQKLQKAVEVYRDRIDNLDRSIAKMELSGASTAEIARANAELSRNSSFLGMATFAIQSIKQRMDRIDNMSQSLLSNLQETQKQIIGNVRG